ncbi:MAG: hypothetical protein V3S04_04890, partial [Candidatus Omnitrophota bacterium]
MKNNICRVLIAIALLLSTSAFLAGEACAQDEYEGFFKRMMKRFQKKDIATTDQEGRTEPRRIESSKPTMPSVPPAPKAVTIPKRPVQVKPNGTAVETPAPKRVEEAELTREEVLEDMIKRLEDNEDILVTVPSIKRRLDDKGNIYYVREQDGMEDRIEYLNDDELENLYFRVL